MAFEVEVYISEHMFNITIYHSNMSTIFEYTLTRCHEYWIKGEFSTGGFVPNDMFGGYNKYHVIENFINFSECLEFQK